MNAIEVRELRKKYGSFEALKGIDLEVRTGEIFGFLGPNGAGKSTTIRILLDEIRATGGTARHSLMIDHSMRPMFAYLGAQAVRTGVFAATEDFGGPGAAALRRRIDEAVGELRSCLTGVERRRPVDGFEQVIPFEELLKRER